MYNVNPCLPFDGAADSMKLYESKRAQYIWLLLLYKVPAATPYSIGGHPVKH